MILARIKKNTRYTIMSRYSPSLLGVDNPVGVITSVASVIPPSISNLITDVDIKIIQKSYTSGGLISVDVGSFATNTDWCDVKNYTSLTVAMENIADSYYALIWANGDSAPTNINDANVTEVSPTGDGVGMSIIRNHMVKTRWVCFILVGQGARASFNLKKRPAAVSFAASVNVGETKNSLYVLPADSTGAALGTYDSATEIELTGSCVYTAIVDASGIPLAVTYKNQIGTLAVGLRDSAGENLSSTTGMTLFYKKFEKAAAHNIILLVDTYKFNEIPLAMAEWFKIIVPVDSQTVNGDGTMTLENYTVFTSTDSGNTWTPMTLDNLRHGAVLADVDMLNDRVIYISNIVDESVVLSTNVIGLTEFIFNKQLILTHVLYDVLPPMQTELSGSSVYALSLNDSEQLATNISDNFLTYISDLNDIVTTSQVYPMLDGLRTIPDASDKASIVIFSHDFSYGQIYGPVLNYINNSSINLYSVNYGPEPTSAVTNIKLSTSIFSDISKHRLDIDPESAQECLSVATDLIKVVGREPYLAHTSLMTVITDNSVVPVASIDYDGQIGSGGSLNGRPLSYFMQDNSGRPIGSSRYSSDISNGLYITLFDGTTISGDNPLYVMPVSSELGVRYIANKQITHTVQVVFDSTITPLTTSTACYGVRTINLVNENADPVWVRIYDMYYSASQMIPSMQRQYVKLNILLSPCDTPGSTRDLYFEKPLEFLYGMYAVATKENTYDEMSAEPISSVYLTTVYNLTTTNYKPTTTIREAPTITDTAGPGNASGSWSASFLNSPIYTVKGWICLNSVNDGNSTRVSYAVTSVSGDYYNDHPSDITVNLLTYIVGYGRVEDLTQSNINCPPYPSIPSSIVAHEVQQLTSEMIENRIIYTDIDITHEDPNIGLHEFRVWGTIGGGGNSDVAARGGTFNLGAAPYSFVAETKTVWTNQEAFSSLVPVETRVITIGTDISTHQPAIAQIDYYKDLNSLVVNYSDSTSPYVDYTTHIVRINTTASDSYEEERVIIIGLSAETVTVADILLNQLTAGGSETEPLTGGSVSMSQTLSLVYDSSIGKYFGVVPPQFQNRITNGMLTTINDKIRYFSSPYMKGHLFFDATVDTSAYYVYVMSPPNYLPAVSPLTSLAYMRVYDSAENWDNAEPVLYGGRTYFKQDLINIDPVSLKISLPNSTNWTLTEALPLLEKKTELAYFTPADSNPVASSTSNTTVFTYVNTNQVEIPISLIVDRVSINGATHFSNNPKPVSNVGGVYNVSGEYYLLGQIKLNQDGTTKRNLAGWTDLIHVTDLHPSIYKMTHAFERATRLEDVRGSFPIGVTSLDYAFHMCTGLNVDLSLSNWNTTNVLSMEGTFKGSNIRKPMKWKFDNTTNLKDFLSNATSFQASADPGSISVWNLSQVINMEGAFRNCMDMSADFTYWASGGPAGGTNTIFAFQNLKETFAGSAKFKGTGLSQWKTPDLTNMEGSFMSCTSFNQDLTSWTVSGVVTMKNTFNGCSEFTGAGLNMWRPTATLTNMEGIFQGCTLFNNDMTGWGYITFSNKLVEGVAGVKTMKNAFNGCSNFQGVGLNRWTTPALTDLEGAFQGCTQMGGEANLTYNYLELGWNVRLVKTMKNTFNGCTIFDGFGVNTWITTSLENMEGTFRGMPLFNRDLTSWTVSGVVTMKNAFNGCVKFQGNGLNLWKTPSLTNLEGTFMDCSSFNKDISGWNSANITDMSGAFSRCGMFVGYGMSKWRPNLTNMEGAFKDCSMFNVDLSGWNITGLGPNGMKNAFSGTAFHGKTLASMLKGWADCSNGQIGTKFVPPGIDLGNLDRVASDNSGLTFYRKPRKLAIKPYERMGGPLDGTYLDIDISNAVTRLRTNGWVINVAEDSDYSDEMLKLPDGTSAEGDALTYWPFEAPI